MNIFPAILILLATLPASAAAHGASGGASAAPGGILSFALAAHVLVGLVAVMSAYALWMGVLRPRMNVGLLRGLSLSAAVSFILSWISGGYYYVVHYGSAVKPIVKESAYPWAHGIVMESKEHIFLLLPILSIALAAFLFLSSEEEIAASRKGIALLSGFAALSGVAVTLAGIIISAMAG